ncbi:hypothetical protein MTR67_026069 [Solanum verrucosum]|uniref:Gag-pol polyprotein n=1 Tax=Solanum verrucosum TaxID=315347 RepID=A0AAF0QY98_SOLVR|nr:hypothetical protein MTR67_026069 [Solanum verrucosum]
MVANECHTTVLIKEMNISCLIINAQKIEEEKLMERSREAKKEKIGDGDFSHSTFDGHGRSKFQQRFPVKSDLGNFLMGTDTFFGCGKSGHRLRDCQSRVDKGKDGRQASPIGSDSSALKQNRFYALITRHDQEGSPDVVTGMLKDFHLDVYALLDPGCILSFVMLFVVMWLRVLHARVKYSTEFPPQTNGQEERAIQILEDMLRVCVIDFKGNWVDHLPLIKFAYNNSYNSSIGMTLFEALYDVRCSSPIELVHPIFYVSLLKKCVGDRTYIVPSESLGIEESLYYAEVIVEILDWQFKKLRNKEVASVKVLWRNKRVEGATWEAEANMMSRYPHLFPSEMVHPYGFMRLSHSRVFSCMHAHENLLLRF